MLLISKHELEKALTGLSKVAPRKASLPVLGCARLQTIDRQTISLTATNLEESLTCQLKVSDAPYGMDTLLQLSDVKSFIKGDKRALLKVEPIAAGGVTISEEISGQTLTREFPAPEAKDFPVMPSCPEQLFDVPDDFISTLARIAPSISPDDTRSALHGILMSPEGLTATNGRQLCHVPYPMPLTEECILRLPTCLFPANMQGPTKIGIAKTQDITRVTLESGNWTWTGRSPFGKYPCWQQVVPKSEYIDWKLELDKEGIPQLSAILQRQPNDYTHKLLTLAVKGDSFELSTDNAALPIVTCHISSLTGTPPRRPVIIDREILLRALSLGHNAFEQMEDPFTPFIATGGMGKLVFMPWKERSQSNATTPSTPEPTKTNEPDNQHKETETMNQENKTNAAASTTTTETAKAPVIPAAPNNGFKVVPAPAPTDSYDELLECLEELRGSIRTINEHAATLSRKIRDQQASFKQRERNVKVAREAIEKLKVSGF
ncbi:MAG: hypothetical protein WCV67_06215 [Victivallaceae bacterium]|jgi:hypothetical protein